jgi:nucleoside-diphosphate-sugar epimerase
MNKKVLITGAAGGIGSPLASRLVEENLVLVDNLSGGSLQNLQRLQVDVPLEECDSTNFDQMEDLFSRQKPTHVVHLAATTSLPECQSEPGRAIRNNVEATANLLELSRMHGCKFIFASTSAVYESTTNPAFSESDQVKPHLIYPLTKLMSENLCESYAKDYGLDVMILRLFNVVGPYQNFFRKSPPLLNYLVLEYLEGRNPILHSDGKQSRDYVSVFDVCQAFELSLEQVGQKRSTNIMNVCSGTKMSVLEIDQIVRMTLGTELAPTFSDSNKFWDSYTKLFQGEKHLDREIVAGEVVKESLGINTTAQNILGLRFSPPELWLPEMVAIIRKDYLKGIISKT